MRVQLSSLRSTLLFLLGMFFGWLLTFYGSSSIPEFSSLQTREVLQTIEASPQVENMEKKEDCVCGMAAERLKRLSKMALFFSHLNASSKAPPTAVEDNEKGLREFLYPPNQHPILDAGDSMRYKPDIQSEPKMLQEEYLFKKILFVGVLTQEEYLPTRAKFLYETWGKEVDKLIFFVGEDCNISTELSYLPVIKLKGIPDKVYPPLRKSFAVMKYMYENFRNQFNWFIRADDDMYVRTKKLKELLTQLHPYEKVYLGRAGTGRKADLGRLRLLPHERYCMGGPGIILSMASLRGVGPHLSNCLNAVLRYSESNYNDDDVEIGRCISRKINIQCSSSTESRQYFLFDYDGQSLNPMTLWTSPIFKKVITIHPIKNLNNMLSLHHFYKTLEFESDYKNLHQMADYLNDLCKQLPPYASPPLSASAGCNLTFHPQLTYFNQSSKLSHQAPSGNVVHRERVPFYLRPVDRYDLQPWTRFNDTIIQEMNLFAPEHAPQASLKGEIYRVLSMLMPYIRSQFTLQTMNIKHILDGYTRFNPHLGREYIFSLKLTAGETKPPIYRKYHVVREIEPQISVVNVRVSPPSHTVNVILPLAEVNANFTEFLKSYAHVGLQYSVNKLHLVVVVFSDENAKLVETVLNDFTVNTFPLSTTLTKAQGLYNNLRAFDIGMAVLEDEKALVLLTDVNLHFAPGFFRRCRSNTELGKRAYFPMPFMSYQSNSTTFSDGSLPHISADKGQWDFYNFGSACLYKQDYDRVRGVHKRQHAWELFESVSASHLDVMQAPEPGLFWTWGVERPCHNLTMEHQKDICLEMKKGRAHEQGELAQYLEGLESRKDSFLANTIF